MYHSNIYGLRPGDSIVEPITELGITKHFAMYLGWDENGIEWVAENKKFQGVRVITAAEYFSGVQSIARIEKFTGSKAERQAVVQNALRIVGKTYDLINYNCEHFVTEVTTGKPVSKQVQVAAGIMALLLIAALFD